MYECNLYPANGTANGFLAGVSPLPPRVINSTFFNPHKSSVLAQRKPVLQQTNYGCQYSGVL